MQQSDIDRLLDTWGPLTVLLIFVTVIPILAGAVICIVHPATLSYEQFLDDITKLAFAVSAAVAGKALKSGLILHGAGTKLAASPLRSVSVSGGSISVSGVGGETLAAVSLPTEDPDLDGANDDAAVAPKPPQ